MSPEAWLRGPVEGVSHLSSNCGMNSERTLQASSGSDNHSALLRDEILSVIVSGSEANNGVVRDISPLLHDNPPQSGRTSDSGSPHHNAVSNFGPWFKGCLRSDH